MKSNNDNLLDRIPEFAGNVRLAEAENGLSRLDVFHNGWADKIAQRVFNKTAVTHISLDRFGSFVCCLIDGKRSIYDIGIYVKEEFGEEAEPLYERLTVYFRTLQNNGLIKLVK